MLGESLFKRYNETNSFSSSLFLSKIILLAEKLLQRLSALITWVLAAYYMMQRSESTPFKAKHVNEDFTL
jgi:hypothetical protein